MFGTIAKELKLKFKKIREYTSHGPTIGTYREAAIKDTLQNFLSNRFRLRTGFIHDPDSDLSSNQVDIITIDENYPTPYFLKEDDFVVANKKAVVCAIEIKSQFNKDKCIEIIKNCSSVRNIDPSIPFFSFCFQGIKNEDRIRKLYSSLDFQNTREFFPDLITLFDSGSLVIPHNEKFGHRFSHSILEESRTEENEICLFVSLFARACFSSAQIDENPMTDFSPRSFLHHRATYLYGENPEK